MEDSKQSKLDRIKQIKFADVKQFVKDNEGPVTFGVGVAVGTMMVAKFPNFFLKPYSMYNPDQPIPGFKLSEGAIVRNSAAGWIAVDFLQEKGLVDEFREFTADMVEASLNVAADK